MRRKTIGKRRRSTTPSATTPSISPIPLLSTAQVPDSNPEFEAVDSLDNDGVCICCNQCDGALLICTGTDCPVFIHVSCIGSQPKFDDSGNFYCPYCWYKRTLNNTKQLKQKALIAKQALASFLDDNQTVRNDPVVEPVKKDELGVSDSEEKERKENEDDDDGDDDDDDKGYVSATGSSVSETNDSDYKAISVKKGNVKRRVRSCVKKSLLPEQNSGGGGDVDEEEVTSSRSRLSKQSVQKQVSLTGGGKRKPLLWTPEEEKALEEGVLKFAKGNKNIPWRKILEFGCRVFDKTRTPVDLKDKWKQMSSKKGCK